ncbi:MAG: ATP-binding protein [Desulfobacteraceae bacterium]|jgi:signal transduction histidine kinase/CheY-like chemotaxis protein/HAMP domain-containing protein
MLKKRHSLSFRINATIWTVCLFLLFLFAILFYGFERQQLKTQVDQSKILLEALFQQKREQMANEIFANHREALLRTLMELKTVKDIDGVHIFDNQGRLMERVGGGRRFDLPERTITALAKGTLFNEIVSDRVPYLTFTSAIEIIGERLGYFTVFFNLSEIQQASQQRILFIVGIFAGLLVILSLLLHLLLTRLVINPVSIVRNAMEQVMRGRLGEQVSLNLNDEIGEVAASFNSMSEQLKEQRQRLLRSMALRDSYAEQLEETNRKLARLNTDLESIVEKRTQELRSSNEKLRNQIQERIRTDQAKRELEDRLARSQKMEALGLLAGGVAHDLNNVLSGIISYPDLILMDLDKDDPNYTMVEGIQKSGHKAAAIVQDLLALARRGVFNTGILNMNDDIVKDYLKSPEFQKLQSYHPGVTIETRLAPDLMNIRGSGVHLRKALMNLVSNAAEAQPHGGRIIISTRNSYVDLPISGYEQVNEGDYVVLRVEDKGMGIAPEDLSRIFEPFYTKKVMGRSGTGLGMAVVWGTVQDHHGYINVNSNIGEGTEFVLYFPVTREKVEKVPEQIGLDTYLGMGEKVLVIDDVEEQRKIASALLSRLNYQVRTVESGEAAVTLLKKECFDILILDMIMDPGIDGLETYTKILDIHPGQKAIIASGYAENQRVKEAQDLGAGAYVRKPYTIENLGLAIREELDR